MARSLTRRCGRRRWSAPDELLALGEAILETWLAAHGEIADDRARRKAFACWRCTARARAATPSFNACRETCRELVYHHNLVRLDPAHPISRAACGSVQWWRGTWLLFIGGKLEVAGLGEFCCAARPLRRARGLGTANETV